MESLHLKNSKGGVKELLVIETKVVIGWFKLQLWMWLVDLNYNFECDWVIELSNKRLFNSVQ